MPNRHVVQRLEGIRQILLGVHSAGSTSSNATRGREREAFIDRFLSGVFPTVFRFGSGDITDRFGARSGQIDVVVEFPSCQAYLSSVAVKKGYILLRALLLQSKSSQMSHNSGTRSCPPLDSLLHVAGILVAPLALVQGLWKGFLSMPWVTAVGRERRRSKKSLARRRSMAFWSSIQVFLSGGLDVELARYPFWV
jgi:hypothetical protein